jgi:4-hydroxy-tetrahydrodipicolinate synthase
LPLNPLGNSMSFKQKFSGSFVALITPMNPNGEVDLLSLENLIEWHIESGTDGFVILGTTAESATLSADEKMQVLNKCIDVNDGRLPIVVGNGTNNTAEAMEITRQYDHLAIDGFLTVTPYYNKPTQRGMLHHFKAIAGATEKPIILYNVPGRTAVDLSNDTVMELMAVNNIVGIKDATGDLTRVKSLKQANPEFILLSGDDASSNDFLHLGGDGVISVTANIRPKEMSQLVKLSTKNQITDAFQLDKKLSALHHDLFVEPNPVPVKWALFSEGRINSDFVRLPLVTMEPNHHATIKQALSKTL